MNATPAAMPPGRRAAMEVARAGHGTALRDIAGPVETRLRTIPGHGPRALGIAWHVAKARRLDARD